MNKSLHISLLALVLSVVTTQTMERLSPPDQYKALMNLKSTDGWAPLHTATYSGNTEAIKRGPTLPPRFCANIWRPP